MKLVSSRVLGYLLPIVAIVALTALVAAALLRLAEIQHDMRSNVSSNMLWVISQARAESQRLSVAIYKHTGNPSDPADLSLRYSMLMSRLNLLSSGPQGRFLSAIGADAEMAAQVAALNAMAGWIAQPALGNAAVIENIQASLQSLSGMLAAASTKAMVTHWEEAGARLDMYRNAVLKIIFLMIGIVVGCGFISVRLLIALKRLREGERGKRHAAELGKQLEAERRVSELYRSFGAMVSHQFRTPLAIIDASMQRLIRVGDGLGPGEAVRRATKVRTAVKRLTQLIDSTLMADRCSGEIDVNMQALDLSVLVSDAVEDQLAVTPARRISIAIQTSALDRAQCDPVLTEHILFNFISNAVKYSPESEPISIRVYQRGDWICCSVSDKGEGIAQDELPQLFERYFRARASANIVGTGLGLYVARQLAMMQGGETAAESVVGKGSVFVLRLRRCLPSAAGSDVARGNNPDRNVDGRGPTQ